MICNSPKYAKTLENWSPLEPCSRSRGLESKLFMLGNINFVVANTQTDKNKLERKVRYPTHLKSNRTNCLL